MEKRQTNRGFVVSLAALTFCLSPVVASAQVIISEIMYDVSGSDTDREWVEVFNAGGSSVQFTDWKLFEANTNHGITSVQGGESLGSGAYAIIADNPTKFLLDWPLFSGILFDSAFSLGNSGETIGVHMPPPELGETDSVAYQSAWGAAGNGNSLQRTSASGSSFTEALPTPGTGTLSASGSSESASGTSSEDTSTISNTSSTSGNSSEDSIMPPPPKVFADGGSDRTVIVGADTEFRARAYDEKKNSIDFASFHWNFGDGSTANTAVVLHHFDYPGRYVVVLDIPEEKEAAPDQVIVTVEPMKLVLSSMPDGGVMIENKAPRTIDLSRWMIRSMGRTFGIPEHTFILANNSLRISQKTLGFSSGADIELAYPNGGFALGVVPEPAPTSTPAMPAPVATTRIEEAQDSEVESPIVVSYAVSEEAVETETIASTTQEASAQVAAAVAVGTSSPWWWGAFGIAALAAGSLALARRFGKKEWDIEEIQETR